MSSELPGESAGLVEPPGLSRPTKVAAPPIFDVTKELQTTKNKKVLLRTNPISGEHVLVFKSTTGKTVEIPTKHANYVDTSKTNNVSVAVKATHSGHVPRILKRNGSLQHLGLSNKNNSSNCLKINPGMHAEPFKTGPHSHELDHNYVLTLDTSKKFAVMMQPTDRPVVKMETNEEAKSEKNKYLESIQRAKTSAGVVSIIPGLENKNKAKPPGPNYEIQKKENVVTRMVSKHDLNVFTFKSKLIKIRNTGTPTGSAAVLREQEVQTDSLEKCDAQTDTFDLPTAEPRPPPPPQTDLLDLTNEDFLQVLADPLFQNVPINIPTDSLILGFDSFLPVPSSDSPQADSLSNWKDDFFSDLKNCDVFHHSGNLPLHIAVMENDPQQVERQCFAMRVRKISVNLPNQSLRTALQLAVINDAKTEILRILLKYGADTSVVDDDGNNLLHLCAIYANSCTVRELLMSSSSFNYDAVNFDGYTALILAVNNKKYANVDALLKACVNPNAADTKSGRTPLFYAIESDDVDMVKLLLNYKANTKAKNYFGTSPHDAMFELESVQTSIKRLILNKYDVGNKLEVKQSRRKRKKHVPERSAKRDRENVEEFDFDDSE